MLRKDNPMNRAISLALIFEVVVFVLAIPGMIQVDDVPLGLAMGAGGAAAVVPLLAAAMLRRPVGWVFAWLAQAAGLALGLLTPWMFVVGGAFALLFVVSFVLGRRIEQTSPGR